MTTHCAACGRTLKAPTPTGMGPKCALYVLGSKPKRAPAVERRTVKRDELTPDLFAEDARQAVRRGFRAARERVGL